MRTNLQILTIMRKSSFSIFLLATAFFSCGQKAGNGQTALAVNDTTAVIERVESIYNEVFACQNKGEGFNGEEYSIAKIAEELVPDSVAFYLYEAPYGQTAENNFIELRFENGKVHDGYFWGTSDEFVDAREGYYPGFAVWQMKDIQSEGGALSFLIDSRGVDYSSGPVSTDIHQMTEAFEKGYHPWEQRSKFFQDTVRYTCTFTPEALTITRKSKYDSGTRRFTRKSSE